MVYRPDLTDYEPIIVELTKRLNADALYPMSKTDVVKIAIEKMFERATGKKPVSKRKKMYILYNS